MLRTALAGNQNDEICLLIIYLVCTESHSH